MPLAARVLRAGRGLIGERGPPVKAKPTCTRGSVGDGASSAIPSMLHVDAGKEHTACVAYGPPLPCCTAARLVAETLVLVLPSVEQADASQLLGMPPADGCKQQPVSIASAVKSCSYDCLCML